VRLQLLTEFEVHELFKVPIATLRTMRSRPGRDPIPYVKVGRLIRYRSDQLEEWVRRNTFFDTEEARSHRMTG
jgi:hypothetical protein